ncbi:MAG TPA: heme exporter protein CcmD [Rudaea sp.]|jgi:heme exporter protein D|nr:heme exporter protein CcmD [Rudaea sp.]
MSDFFGMGGYGAYVWPAYLVFFVVLLFDALSPFIQRRRAMRELQSRLKREAAKRS